MSKIKTFKEFINENLWADLQDRSSGEVVRKEDDINALDADGFYHYIKDHYSFNNGALTMGNPGGPFIIAAPVVNSGRFIVHYLILWSDSVRFEIPNYRKSKYMDFIELLEKEYTVKPMEPVDNPTSEYINILPKDGSEVTNRFFIEVLDFFIANIEKHTQGEYLNVEKIQVNESVWGDLHSRGIGELEREEYNVNFLDRKGFYEYMKEHYGEKIKDIDVRLDNYWGEGLNVHTHIKQVNLCIDSFYDRNENITRLRIYPYDDEKTTLAHIETPALKKRFKVTHSEYLNYADTITEKDDTCTNQTYVDLVELILDHFSLKVNENLWADLQDRSSGEVIRKEDEFNPEHIDFGKDTSVYWAVENLEIDGKNKFYFDEVKDYNNNGWRLPSVEEVKELAWWNVKISWDGSTHIKFQDGNELRIHTDTMYGFHMWTKDINKKFKNNIWTYGFDNLYFFNIDSSNKSINRCFVFLVKDKKKQ